MPDSTSPRQDEVLERLGARVDATELEQNVVHLDVEVTATASEAAAVEFWTALETRFTVLATDPEPSAIRSRDFDDRYDILAASDVPSAVLAARLMRIDVGKELEPMSTVTIETESGTRIDARNWIVEIVDDGSPPGWDEPGRLAAGARNGKGSAGAPTADEASAGSFETETPERAQTTVGGRAPHESRTPGRPSDERNQSEEDRDGATPDGRNLDRLHAALDAFDDGARRPDSTPTAGRGKSEESTRLRLRHIEAKLQAMESYAAVIEQFVDEHGTPRRAFDGLERQQDELGEDLDDVRTDLEALRASVDEVANRTEERIEEQAQSIERQERQLERQRDRIERRRTRQQRHDDRLEDHQDRLDHVDDRIATLEDTAGSLFALQRAQWKDLRERIETLENRERQRIESLEQSIEQRDRTLRKTLAAWITDAELELFEMDDRVSANETWRRSITEATSLDPESE